MGRPTSDPGECQRQRVLESRPSVPAKVPPKGRLLRDRRGCKRLAIPQSLHLRTDYHAADFSRDWAVVPYCDEIPAPAGSAPLVESRRAQAPRPRLRRAMTQTRVGARAMTKGAVRELAVDARDTRDPNMVAGEMTANQIHRPFVMRRRDGPALPGDRHNSPARPTSGLKWHTRRTAGSRANAADGAHSEMAGRSAWRRWPENCNSRLAANIRFLRNEKQRQNLARSTSSQRRFGRKSRRVPVATCVYITRFVATV